MPQDSNTYTLEQLLEAAKTKDQFPEAKVEQRLLKEIDDFVREFKIEHGSTKIHNVIVYDVFKKWGKSNLSLLEFKEAFGYFYPEHRNNQNNICFKLSKKYNGGKFDTSSKNLKACRSLYGKKATKEVATVEREISGVESEGKQNQS